jgi:hypothetical protein
MTQQFDSKRQFLSRLSDWLDENPREALSKLEKHGAYTEGNCRLSERLKKQIADESKTLNTGSRITQ